MLSYETFFPFPNIREEQKRAIEFALDAFLKCNKKYVMLEMGPGCGKSAIAITISRYLQALCENDNQAHLGGSYVLTTQKVLQEQYMRDFAAPNGNLKLLKSASTYCCQMFETSPDRVSCAEIQRLLKSKAQVGFLYQMCNEFCTYRNARKEFTDGVEGITNYAYFLTASTYANDFEQRGLLILDEAHNIESAVSNFVRISFSNFFYKAILGVKTLPITAKQAEVYDWLITVCLPRLKDVIKNEAKKINKIEDSNEAFNLARKLESLRRNLNKIEHFKSTYDPNVWVLDSSKTDNKGERVYEFKPINVGRYCQSMLFSRANKILILSATILDKVTFCESVGINQNDVSYLRIPSPFSVQKRPIHYIPVGSMSKSMIDSTLPNMGKVVDMLLKQHPNEKGIIHCVNYRIARFLLDTLGDKRLLTHSSDNRDEVIAFHLKSKHPTVLLSPSMMEGVDLADDASRFQIMCKVPFPYLGDVAIKKRMQQNPSWYNYQTVKSVVQAFGRSIRNENDFAVSYILDSDWKNFFTKTKDMFPQEFCLALKD